MAKKLGILGGTFDPIHLGHLHLAKCAKDGLNLDKVLFIPAATSPFKEGKTLSFADRLTMTAIAVADEPDFEVSAIEALREGKSYTYDTILTLKRMYLAWEIYFLSGADALDNFARWYNWRWILKNCYLAVFSRPGYELKLAQELAEDELAKEKILLLNTEKELDISSTVLREGRGDEYLPPAVKRYITEHKLYRR